MIKKVTLSNLEKSFGIKKNNFSNKFLQIYKLPILNTEN